MKRIALALLSTAVLAAPALGQEPAAGTRIRLHPVGSPPVTAVLLRLTPDTIVYLRHPDDTLPVSVPTEEIARLDLSRGRAGAGTGLARGAAMGAVAGGALLILAYTPCEPPDEPFGGLACIGDPGREGAALGGMAAGAVIGALVGVLARGERWVRIDGNPPMR